MFETCSRKLFENVCCNIFDTAWWNISDNRTWWESKIIKHLDELWKMLHKSFSKIFWQYVSKISYEPAWAMFGWDIDKGICSCFVKDKWKLTLVEIGCVKLIEKLLTCSWRKAAKFLMYVLYFEGIVTRLGCVTELRGTLLKGVCHQIFERSARNLSCSKCSPKRNNVVRFESVHAFFVLRKWWRCYK